MFANNKSILLPSVINYLLCGGYLLNWTQRLINVVSDQSPMSHHATTVQAITNLQECRYALLKRYIYCITVQINSNPVDTVYSSVYALWNIKKASFRCVDAVVWLQAQTLYDSCLRRILRFEIQGSNAANPFIRLR